MKVVGAFFCLICLLTAMLTTFYVFEYKKRMLDAELASYQYYSGWQAVLAEYNRLREECQ